MNPDIDELRKTFTYDPETGELRRGGSGEIVASPSRVWRGWRPYHLCFALHHGRWPHEGMVIDHINGDWSDNRIVNLRECTVQQNVHNSRKSSVNTSGYKGVTWASTSPYKGKWKSQINLNGRRHHLGYFNDPKEAHEAYCAKARELHGEFFNAG